MPDVTFLYVPSTGVTAVLDFTVQADPPVTDPSPTQTPGGWSITVAEPADGTYPFLASCVDSNGSFTAEGTVTFPLSDDVRPAWTPSAERVAGLIPNRTQPRSGAGVALGIFTDDTRPTGAQVEQICGAIAREVETATGGLTLPADLYDSAADVATTGAAARVELAFYRDEDSRYVELQELYDSTLARLVAAVVARRDAEAIPGGGVADLPPSPAGSFPLPMTRRDERW